MTIRWPANSALRHSSMAQAACTISPSLIRFRTWLWRKASAPRLKVKLQSASNWFWVSGLKTFSFTTWATAIRS